MLLDGVGAALPSIVRVMAGVEDSLAFDVVFKDSHPARSSVFEDSCPVRRFVARAASNLYRVSNGELMK
jgi:hypothetical protein